MCIVYLGRRLYGIEWLWWLCIIVGDVETLLGWLSTWVYCNNIKLLFIYALLTSTVNAIVNYLILIQF